MFHATQSQQLLGDVVMTKPTLVVDFDGVLHSYISGWKGASIIPDPPVPGALRWLLKAVKQFRVMVYSSRSKDREALTAMRMWLNFHARQELAEPEVDTLLSDVEFADEKPSAFLTIDDRCVCFDGDFSKLDPETLLKFKPWNHKDVLQHVTPTQTGALTSAAGASTEET